MTAFREQIKWCGSFRMAEDLFRDAGIQKDAAAGAPYSSQIANMVEAYYAAVDACSPDDVRRLLSAFERVLDWDGPEQRNALLAELARDGIEEVGGRLRLIGGGLTPELQRLAASLDWPRLEDACARLNETVVDDPWAAIGHAKDLIETVCKTVIAERGAPESARPKLRQLLNATYEALALDKTALAAEGEHGRAILQILEGLADAVDGVGQIRNRRATGHGQHARTTPPDAGSAKLAAGAASALCWFIVDWHLAERGGGGGACPGS